MSTTTGTIDVGSNYYIGLHLIVCHGPVDAVGKFIIGDREATTEVVEYSGGEIQQIYIDKPELFGGERRTGGVRGYVDVMFGGPTQAQNAYLALHVDDPDILPNYRGLVSVVLKRVLVAANNPLLRPWHTRITNIPGQSWYAAKAKINIDGTDASANGAHIIREVLLNNDWGLGYDASKLDSTSFVVAADTLYDEGLGLSMILGEQGSHEKFLQDVLFHINGILYVNQQTGLFTLKLIRDDYVVGTLPIFNEDNIVSLDSFQRPAFAEMVNEVTIKYQKRDGLQNKASLTMQDTASIAAQGGIIPETLEFPGIDDIEVAKKIGIRELRQRSTPLASVEMKVNRDGWDLGIGDVFVWQWDDYGIQQMVLRVTQINYGTIQNSKITVSCLEDIFAYPQASYIQSQDSLFEDPIQEPVAITVSRLEEIPYFRLATTFPTSVVDQLSDDAAFIMHLAEEPTVATIDYELWSRIGSLVGFTAKSVGRFALTATLTSPITRTDSVNIQFNVFNFDTEEIIIGSYALLGDEYVRIDDVDAGSTQLDLGRGCLDTIPVEHAAGTKIWMVPTRWAADGTEYENGDEIDVKALPATSIGRLEIGDATLEEITVNQRLIRPYPIANVEFGSNGYWPDQTYGQIIHTWANRNRVQQTVPNAIIDWFDGNVSLEDGATYTFRYFAQPDILNADDDPTIEFTGITGTSRTWDTEIADSNIGAYSPPDGYDMNMPLWDDADIGGTLSPWSTAQNVTNVTFPSDRALFSAGYMDIGDFSIGANWDISFQFIPSSPGTGLQCLISKYDASNFVIFGLWYNSANGALYIAQDSGDQEIVTDGQVCPLNKLSEVRIKKRGTAPTAKITIYVNGRDETGELDFDPTSWTGQSWTLGAGYSTGGSRLYQYTGQMSDLRIWDVSSLTVTDFWPTSRASNTFRIRIFAIRDTFISKEIFDHTVTERTGWGLSWGNNWNGRF